MQGFGNRALADVLGGSSGGWFFWRAGLSALEVAVERSLEREQAFTSHPPGELRRLLVDVEDALGLLELAADVQAALNADGDEAGAVELAGTLAGVLAERVRAARLRG